MGDRVRNVGVIISQGLDLSFAKEGGADLRSKAVPDCARLGFYIHFAQSISYFYLYHFNFSWATKA